jgi:molybdopterin/thiamine biosynthesis adenylyltransferase
MQIIDPDNSDRFSRFQLINWWEQQRLKNAKVLVVGAGALGNEILKNLALLGFGNIFIADLDSIENSNLSRSILYRERDNGASKAETAAKMVKEIYPEINVNWFHGDVIYSLGLGVYNWADLIIAGLDNREARLSINYNCWKTNTPWIDGAIEQLNGVARVFRPPHGVCYECTMSETDWKIIRSRQGCGGLSTEQMLTGHVPTTPTTSSIIAGIQCQEAVKLLHGMETLEGKGYIFNGLTNDSYVIEYQRKEMCSSHETYDEIRRTELSSRTIKISEVLDLVREELGPDAVIEFSRFNSDIIEKFDCPECNKSEELFLPLGSTKESRIFCPECKTERIPGIFHSISGNEDFLQKTFCEIGLPPFDIIACRNNERELFIEFSSDAPEVLGSLFKIENK